MDTVMYVAEHFVEHYYFWTPNSATLNEQKSRG